MGEAGNDFSVPRSIDLDLEINKDFPNPADLPCMSG